MKLDIGCGRKPHKGYKTIDVEAYANPDYLGDFRTMNFSDIEEIRSHHLLEHFSEKEAIEVIKQWRSWLKPGGLLFIETPDFEGICRDFNTDKYWITRHAYGDQALPWAFHKSGWYEEKFRNVLTANGFKVITCMHTKSRKILPNITVIAEKI